jgi:hypothetical protein
MATIITDALNLLVKIGLLEALAFLLVFVITYGILEKANIFGTDKRNVHLIISLVIGLMAVGAMAYADLINQIGQSFGLLVVVLLCVLLVFGIMGGRLPILFKSKESKGSSAPPPSGPRPRQPGQE